MTSLADVAWVENSHQQKGRDQVAEKDESHAEQGPKEGIRFLALLVFDLLKHVGVENLESQVRDSNQLAED